MSDETTNSLHTPTPNPKNKYNTSQSRPPSPNSKYTSEDQSSAENQVEPTGRATSYVDTVKQRIERLIFYGVLRDELR